MTASLSLRTFSSAVLVVSVLSGAGCAVSPPVAEKMVIAPVESTMTYHRKSSGGLGAYDGKVVWNMTQSTWQGQTVYSFGSPLTGVSLHEPSQCGFVAQINPAGQPTMSFDPPIAYPWPLEVGKTWTMTHTMTLHVSGKTMPLHINGKVASWGDVTVPAGTFKAYKLVWTDSTGDVETRWISPMDALATIKRQHARNYFVGGVLDPALERHHVVHLCPYANPLTQAVVVVAGYMGLHDLPTCQAQGV
jgi:hypothetical protein